MLLVQKYLETHSFKELQEEHGVYTSFNKTGDFFSLNYDMIESREDDLLSQECRGVILSKNNGASFLPESVWESGKIIYNHICPGNTRLLCFGMKRFFNYGQSACAPISWSDPNLKVLEKLDGSLCQIWHNPFTKKWNVATRSCPEADLLMDNDLFTFRTLFEKAVQDTLNKDFDTFTQMLEKDYTYCFELTTPYNRIVVNYPNNKITLLTVRSLITEQELDFNHPIVKKIVGVPLVKSYIYTSVSELIDWVSSLNPLEHEGVVVKQGENRIKIKNPSYIAYNRVRDTLGASERNCIEIILQEKDDDVIPFLPEEIVKNLQKLKAGILSTIKNHDDAYLIAKEQADAENPGDKKTFALIVNSMSRHLNNQLWTAPLFQMFDNKASSMKDFIQKNKKEGTWGNSFLDKFLEMAKSM